MRLIKYVAGNRDAMLILFATMTGNAEDAAEIIAKKLRKTGHTVKVANIEKFSPADLSAETEPVLFTASTWGEGEPPDEALDFWEALEKSPTGSLTGLEFAVYALGDSSYDEFCGFGRKLDEMLETKGGIRIASRAECDCDHEEFIDSWTEEVRLALTDEFAA